MTIPEDFEISEYQRLMRWQSSDEGLADSYLHGLSNATADLERACHTREGVQILRAGKARLLENAYKILCIVAELSGPENGKP